MLSESGKTSSFIDDVSIVKRYASGTCHAFPVSSDDEALSRASKEVFDTPVFLCTRFPLRFLIFICSFQLVLCLAKIFYHFTPFTHNIHTLQKYFIILPTLSYFFLHSPIFLLHLVLYQPFSYTTHFS